MIPMVGSSQAGHKPSRLLALAAGTHRALGSPHAELHADCLEEAVANHLISILASAASHLQQHGAEQNAVEQGQTALGNQLSAGCPGLGAGEAAHQDE